MSRERDEAPIVAETMDPGPFGPRLKTFLATRRLLAMYFANLSLDQVTRTTPELLPLSPNFPNMPTLEL
ncbi:hypothetical protein TNCV_766321 [Trichonephila clavipes]|nr:hypothetical protein TNCV_766321 [Trichonephila clavipes]